MTETVLDCKGLTKSFNSSTQVLKNFDLSICRGRVVGLLGKNGAGKTTLLECAMGLLKALVVSRPKRDRSERAPLAFGNGWQTWFPRRGSIESHETSDRDSETAPFDRSKVVRIWRTSRN